MERTEKLQEQLQKAVLELRQGNAEPAITILSKARHEIIGQISSKQISSDANDLLCQVSALAYLAMLHYFALAKKRRQEGDLTSLTYLGESLGISNILDSILFPLLTIDNSGAAKQLCSAFQPGESCREELCKEIALLIEKSRSSESKRVQEYDALVRKITESVNPALLKVRELALRIASRFEAGDFKQARRVYEYVRDEIRYMRDPIPFEDIQSPDLTLERLSGDCEDQAILLCSLLLAIGFETALLFADTDRDGLADHVYSAVNLPDAPEIYKTFGDKKIGGRALHDWIPMDPTSEDLDFGIITFDNLEIKHVLFYEKKGKRFIGS